VNARPLCGFSAADEACASPQLGHVPVPIRISPAASPGRCPRTGSHRSPSLSTRFLMVLIVNLPGSSVRRTSDHLSGTETVAPGQGRAQYGADRAWPRELRVVSRYEALAGGQAADTGKLLADEVGDDLAQHLGLSEQVLAGTGEFATLGRGQDLLRTTKACRLLTQGERRVQAPVVSNPGCLRLPLPGSQCLQ